MRQLTHSETCMVNAYFNFLSLIQGQRPMEYQLMELEQFARAKKAGLQSTEGCEPSDQLATDKHKTANKLFKKHFLFINNNDHHKFNPSSGLGL